MQAGKSDIQERSYQFGLNVIRFLETVSERSATKVIRDQLIRSATSVGANIVEAQSASSKRDFVNFLNHALKSANETRYWLRLLHDSHNLDASSLTQEAVELAKILAKSVITLKNQSRRPL